MFPFSFLYQEMLSDSHNTDAISHAGPRLKGRNRTPPTSLQELNWDLGTSFELNSWRGQAYRLSQNRRLVLTLLEARRANCFALSFPSPLRHTPTNVLLPVSSQRYGREAHAASAVVVRETLPKLHRTKNSMTFPLISASCFLKAYNHSASCRPR